MEVGGVWCSLPFSCGRGLKPSYSGGQASFSTRYIQSFTNTADGRRGNLGPAGGQGAHGGSGVATSSLKMKAGPTSRSVVIRTRLEPERNSLMIRSLSFWSMSPCWRRTGSVINREVYGDQSSPPGEELLPERTR